MPLIHVELLKGPALTVRREHPERLILVDLAETARVAQPGVLSALASVLSPGGARSVQDDQEAGPALRRLGFDPAHVRWVLMTHLHTDHAGGLAHFPDSQIIVSRIEIENASGTLPKLRG